MPIIVHYIFSWKSIRHRRDILFDRVRLICISICVSYYFVYSIVGLESRCYFYRNRFVYFRKKFLHNVQIPIPIFTKTNPFLLVFYVSRSGLDSCLALWSCPRISSGLDSSEVCVTRCLRKNKCRLFWEVAILSAFSEQGHDSAGDPCPRYTSALRLSHVSCADALFKVNVSFANLLRLPKKCGSFDEWMSTFDAGI